MDFHALDHGIPPDAHKAPEFRRHGDFSDPPFLPGMVFTLEPGMYHPKLGGVRSENDVVSTDDGVRVLACAQIMMIP